MLKKLPGRIFADFDDLVTAKCNSIHDVRTSTLVPAMCGLLATHNVIVLSIFPALEMEDSFNRRLAYGWIGLDSLTKSFDRIIETYAVNEDDVLISRNPAYREAFHVAGFAACEPHELLRTLFNPIDGGVTGLAPVNSEPLKFA
jgi:hypothetical protein